MPSRTESPGTASALIDMLAERTSLWDITPERVDAIYRARSLLTPSLRAIVDGMIREAEKEQRVWAITAERMAAVYQVVSGSSAVRQQRALDDLIAEVRTGALHDNVEDHPWVTMVIDFLENERSKLPKEDVPNEEVRLPALSFT